MTKRHHRFFNMYLTTTVSIVLVLFLIGMETILVISAHDLMRQIKENIALTIVLNDDAPADEVERLGRLLDIAPFVREYHLTDKEEALDLHIRNLGEDPSAFLGFNPLLASYDVKLNAAYAHADSIAHIEQRLSVFSAVNKIVYQKDIISALDQNLGNVSLILLSVACILLFVAVALIVNTIRLSVYSRRFLINTMKLVGATPWVIKSPIIWRNVRMGLVAGIFALVLLGGALFYCRQQLGLVLLSLEWSNLLIVAGVVILSGLCIAFMASLFAVNRYIRMKTDDLYYI
ncbi:MAG: permease-like cell division protein FtsX [Paludibacter sp.]|nr:permease-like cell division protein FtsX [Bacteroidales bacterium]MCM1069576.1 permease-like cell division protein FtsX [Prevotella sp.]MCM1354222.1 permease-like cell division protein FtsX [Bacteroides sp.]MCM1443039.1 permease-like cell division protein FtsX [Muribaculum sp.]MCM1482296.1 permease-like cell division protein FtsX [Paludibacter sp.]